ncbi:hypothetical protein, partial [Acinetobacter lwoffii]|uniref:hypothetical protein n=1 Tax=Acinetobacter lwoffii TaxID=28090 RepID=UPI001BB2D129
PFHRTWFHIVYFFLDFIVGGITAVDHLLCSFYNLPLNYLRYKRFLRKSVCIWPINATKKTHPISILT